MRDLDPSQWVDAALEFGEWCAGSRRVSSVLLCSVEDQHVFRHSVARELWWMLVQTSRGIHGQNLSTKARRATELSAEEHSEFSEASRSCSADVDSSKRSLDEDSA